MAHLALTTGQYTPQTSDPSTTTTLLGFGWIAYVVILAATVATNAGNIYASALGISNLLQGRPVSLRLLLGLSALGIIPLALGTAVYWVVAFGFPRVREGITATLPTVVIAALVYLFWQASQGQRARSRSKG